MGHKFLLHPGVFFLAALWILILPPAWGIGALMAMAVHELCHILAILFFRERIYGINLMPWGAEILTTPTGKGKDALCALAGPAGSFSMLLISEHFPEAALCGLFQGAYNLLPIYPLDGGRVLNSLLGAPVAKAVEAFALTMLTGICLWLFSLSGELALMLLLFVWNPVFQRKFSCKESNLAVQ